MTSVADNKLKILVIHGFRQNATSSRMKTGSLRKMLKKYAELVYITAPHQIQKESETASEEYGWWFYNEKFAFNAVEGSTTDIGHEESVRFIQEEMENKGPFDGILGFSQGATMVSHICALRESTASKFNFRFAILCAGFKSRVTSHEMFYVNQISCPSLHVYGESDKVISREMSAELMSCFRNADHITHNGGHYIPATSKEKPFYVEFLQRFIKE